MLRLHLVALLTTLAVLVLGGTAEAVPAARVLGGAAAAPGAQPWAVHLRQYGDGVVSSCSGTLVSATEAITAAHCVQSFPAEPIRVFAGWKGKDGDGNPSFEQTVDVATVRVHPYYEDSGTAAATPDDVAKITFEAPLVLGSLVQPIAGVATAKPPAGASMLLTGYGKPALGHLRTLPVTVADPVACGSANAILLCSSAADGASCGGDSGGGVLTTGAVPLLTGVHSAGGDCQAGDAVRDTDVTAPEIRAWLVDGAAAPPRAPRWVPAQPMTLTSFEDGRVQCGPGGWDAPATYGTQVIRLTAAGALPLATDATGTHVVGPQDAGTTLSCRVSATNAGGTGERVATASTVVPRAWGLTFRADTVRLALRPIVSGSRSVLTVVGSGGGTAASWSDAQIVPPLTIPRTAPADRYVACVRMTPTAATTAWTECATSLVDRPVTRLVAGRRRRARAGRARLRLTSTGAARGSSARVTWRSAQCARCRGRVVRRTRVTLRARTSLVGPVTRRRHVRVEVRLPARPAAGGATWTAGALTFALGRVR